MAQEFLPYLPDAVAPTESIWDRVETRLERISEWLNPILVKEARQAFKSYQFLITFLLLLVLGWGWSLLGVVVQMPGVQFGAGGSYLLSGYFLILIVPLLVVVPFSAFRSLAAEREDGTFEILSITTLSARQIVTGKLGSAVLQMLVYYSAISPCIAFTYLLRGIDIVVIGIILFYSFAISMLVCCYSLMNATITRSRAWQVLISVALILSLTVVTIGWSSLVLFQFIDSGWTAPVHEPEFWSAQLNLVCAIVAICVLFIAIARGQISFASDNRAGPLRKILLAHQVLFLGWVVYWLTMINEPEFLIVMCAFAAVYWSFFGSFMCGEGAHLSPRVRRQLPQSLLGRMFLTWFNPGSGTGYVFCITNLAVVMVSLLAMGLGASAMGGNRFMGKWNWVWFGVLAWCYVASYLGVTRLIMLVLGRWVRPNIFLSFLICILLSLAGCAVPFLAESAVTGFRSVDYTVLQFTNWWWTLYFMFDRDIWLHPLVVPLVAISTGVIVLLQFVTMGSEVFQIRVAVPLRVTQDDKVLHPSAAHEPERSGPWD